MITYWYKEPSELMKSKEEFFLILEFILINVERRMDIENHLLTNTKIIIVVGNNWGILC